MCECIMEICTVRHTVAQLGYAAVIALIDSFITKAIKCFSVLLTNGIKGIKQYLLLLFLTDILIVFVLHNQPYS